mgnify:CR=1 FL=1
MRKFVSVFLIWFLANWPQVSVAQEETFSLEETFLFSESEVELASGVDTPGNFHLYDRDGTSVFSMTLAVDRSPSFSFDKSMADVMLTLGHEERYVLTFGRELFFGAGTQYHRFT